MNDLYPASLVRYDTKRAALHLEQFNRDRDYRQARLAMALTASCIIVLAVIFAASYGWAVLTIAAPLLSCVSFSWVGINSRYKAETRDWLARLHRHNQQ